MMTMHWFRAKQLCLLMSFEICTVSTVRFMHGIPKWDSMDVQGKIETSKIVDTYLQSARYCQQSDVCDTIFFNNTTGYCAIVENNDGNVIKDTIVGEFFYRKKNCLYYGYEYIWQLDTCIMFYTTKLTWNDSQQRCVEDNGNLISVETARKDYFFFPFLIDKYEKTGMVLWWIGGTDASQEGIFRWIKDGENVTYSNWDIDQPDDGSDGIPGANCMRYIIKSKTKATWWDLDCNNEFAFICENKMFSLL